MKRLLMIAYHFPPLAGSSGIQRTLRLVQHLPSLGWEPIVLSAHPRAYEKTRRDLLDDVPAATVVRRAFALDTARHLCVGGRYIGAMARPDRWISWKFDAVRQGMKLIRDYQPDAIWSTYPIPTAHLIGRELQCRSGIPWLADFRDPMAQPGYPSDPATWRQFDAIEKTAMQHAALSIFTTPGAARVYRERYPAAAARIVVLENGFDENSFIDAQAAAAVHEPLNRPGITLLHSGIVYPAERDPTPFFVALRRLLDAGQLPAGRLKVRFRSAVHDDLLRRLAQQHGVQALVEMLPALDYRDALVEMLRADALLVLQGADCNEQIPAKTYEYLRAHRPILCLADPAGDTAGVVRGAGIDSIAALESSDAICALLPGFLAAVEQGRAPLPDAAAVRQASRSGRTGSFVHMLERATVGVATSDVGKLSCSTY